MPYAREARHAHPGHEWRDVLGGLLKGVLVRDLIPEALSKVASECVAHLDHGVGVQVFLRTEAGEDDGYGSGAPIRQPHPDVVRERDVGALLSGDQALAIASDEHAARNDVLVAGSSQEIYTGVQPWISIHAVDTCIIWSRVAGISLLGLFGLVIAGLFTAGSRRG